MSAEDGDLTVAIDGFLEPTTEPIETALTTLWRAARELMIHAGEREALRRLIGTGDAKAVEWHLDYHGLVEVEVGLVSGRSTTVRAWRGVWQTPTQRVAARYRPEQLPCEGRAPGLWGVRDLEKDELVEKPPGSGAVLRFAVEDSAKGWIRSEINTAGYGGYRFADT